MHIPTPFVTAFDKANQWLYALTGGRPRTHALFYVKDGEDLAICASNNGQAHYPAWYWNLQSNPRARVQVGRLTYDVIAQEMKGAAYERLWQRFLCANPLYSDHRKRTDRHFPIFALRPVPGSE